MRSTYKEVMRFLAFLATLLVALNAGAETPASRLWAELTAKREKLPSLHQEFDVSQTYKTTHGSQSSKRQIILDISQEQWREKSVAGSGNYITIFDGENLFRMEEGGDEYVRFKRRSKMENPAPLPYSVSDSDWSKAVELERLPCGIPQNDHLCVVLEAPVKTGMRLSSANILTTVLEGRQRVLLDTETGVILSSRTVQQIDINQRGGYQSDTTYLLKLVSYSRPADASLFKLPSNDLREVRELSPWNASKIRKQLAGRPAPELAVTDLKGKTLTLSGFKGRTVLLDFWTTWCPPCRADGPALEKLYRRYGEKQLTIVGISVGEDREIVEKFLNEHPHSYPIVLTTENEMPRPYQIRVFPTYIVIDGDGTVSAAVQGDRGFGNLRKLLAKAGLETE